MEGLVVIKTDDLTQIIRDVFTALPQQKENVRPVEPPITTKDLCDFLGLTEQTIIRWRQKGKIPFMQIGSAIRYDKAKVIAALEVKTKKRG